MMRFPSFSRRYDRYQYSPPNYIAPPIKETPLEPVPAIESSEGEKKENRTLDGSPLIEIFGISLYFDDILLVCLIFFLFQEDVDDPWLYISLLLLLLS